MLHGTHNWIPGGIVPTMIASLAIASTQPAPVAPERATVVMVASPEALVERYSVAMKNVDFAAAAALMHPEALAVFQRIFADLAAMDATGQAARQLFRLAEGQTLASLTPAEGFERVMLMLTTAVPGMADALKSSTSTVLGTVREGDLVHVVYRSRMDLQGNVVSKVEVLSAKRDGDSWRAMLRGDMEQMLTGIINRMKASKGA